MNENKKRKLIQSAVLFLSVIFILTGILRGEHLEVLRKAVKICLSCIGLG